VVYDDTVLKTLVSSETETVSGNPISFSTDFEQHSAQSIVGLEPIQDLHGYSKPWVGGAGKNILPLTVDYVKAQNTQAGSWSGNVYTRRTTTFTLLTDDDNNVIGVRVQRPAAATTNDSLYLFSGIPSFLDANTNYILSGCPSGGTDSGYCLQYNHWTEGESYIPQDTGSGVTFHKITDSTTQKLRIKITMTDAIDLIFYPMIRLATETDATFAPYTNHASISGRSEINVLGCGKNLFSVDSISLNRDTKRTEHKYINKIPAGNYIVTWDYSGTSTQTTISFRNSNDKNKQL
jgi:hypothetical protein